MQVGDGGLFGGPGHEFGEKRHARAMKKEQDRAERRAKHIKAQRDRKDLQRKQKLGKLGETPRAKWPFLVWCARLGDPCGAQIARTSQKQRSTLPS